VRSSKTAATGYFGDTHYENCSRTPYKRSSQNLSFPRTRVNKGMEKGRDC
jgi:hypothetical protein